MALNIYPKDQALRDTGDVAVAVLEFLKAQFPRVPVGVLYESLGRVREHLVRSFAGANTGDPEFDIRVDELRRRLDPEGPQRFRDEMRARNHVKLAGALVREIIRQIRVEMDDADDADTATDRSAGGATDAISPTPKSPEA